MAAALPFLQAAATALSLYNAISTMVNKPKTLSWDEAVQQASDVVNPLYDQYLRDSLTNLDRSAMARGFYGQMPADALRGERAAQVEQSRAQQISELANQLRGQSLEAALQWRMAAQNALQQNLSNLLNKEKLELDKWATQAQVTGLIPGTNQPVAATQIALAQRGIENMANRGVFDFDMNGVGFGQLPMNPYVKGPLNGAVYSTPTFRNWSY